MQNIEIQEERLTQTAHHWMKCLTENIVIDTIAPLCSENAWVFSNPNYADLRLENRIISALNTGVGEEDAIYEMCVMSGVYIDTDPVNHRCTVLDIFSTEVLNEAINSELGIHKISFIIEDKGEHDPKKERIQKGIFEHSHSIINMDEYEYGAFFNPLENLPNVGLTILYPIAAIQCLQPHDVPDYYHIQYLKIRTVLQGGKMNTTAFSQCLMHPNLHPKKPGKLEISTDMIETIRSENNETMPPKTRKPMVIDPTPYCIHVTHSKDKPDIMEIPIILDLINEDLIGIPF